MPEGHIDGCLFLVTHNNGDCACASESRRYKKLALLSMGTFIIEVVSGILTGSLSLLSDAAHVFIDGFESVMNVYIANRARAALDDAKMNERVLRRLGADISAVLIFIASLLILREAFERFSAPHAIHAIWAMVFGLIGLVVNIWQAKIHLGAPSEHHNETHAWQMLHIASDAAGSVLVILGVGLSMFGYVWGDIAATFIIVLIIWGRVGYHLYSRLRQLGTGKHEAHSHNHGHGHGNHHH